MTSTETIRTEPGTWQAPPVTWTWSGEFDLSDTAALETSWQQLAGGPAQRITIDMSAVTFLDCAVLSFLLTAREQAGPRLVLRAVPRSTAHLIQLTGLSDVLTPVLPEPLGAPAGRCSA